MGTSENSSDLDRGRRPELKSEDFLFVDLPFMRYRGVKTTALHIHSNLYRSFIPCLRLRPIRSILKLGMQRKRFMAVYALVRDYCGCVGASVRLNQCVNGPSAFRSTRSSRLGYDSLCI